MSANAVTKPNCGARIVIDDWLRRRSESRTMYPLECYGRCAGASPGRISSAIGPVWTSNARMTRIADELAGPSAAWTARGNRGESAYRAWSAALRAGAAAGPRGLVPNPPIAVLRGRLRSGGRRYESRSRGCTSSGRGSRRRTSLSREALTVGRSHAPCRRFSGSSTRSGRRATIAPAGPTKDSTSRRCDRSGRPFLVVFNHWRGPHGGGGQWATERRPLPVRTRVDASAT